MTQLLSTLQKEVDALNEAGSRNLQLLVDNTDNFLDALRAIEADLAAQVEHEQSENAPNTNGNGVSTSVPTDTGFDSLEIITSSWYNDSIRCLKGYNGQILKFLKNIVNNSKFRADLDDAYTYPLELDSAPLNEVSLAAARQNGDARKLENRQNLLKSIAVHFLKTGHGDCLDDILTGSSLVDWVDTDTILKFAELSRIVDDLKTRHDLTLALQWLSTRERDSPELLIRLHMLQYVLVLNDAPMSVFSGDEKPDTLTEAEYAAYKYAIRNFALYFKYDQSNVESVFFLIALKPSELRAILKDVIFKAIEPENCSELEGASRKSFVLSLIQSFDDIHSNQSLFDNLAHRLTAHFCDDLGLSRNSSLFEALLAGFVNLPNFYKYNRLQQKLGQKQVEDANADDVDLPFLIPDKNRFLFEYHPIFICPVSKEQLQPLTGDDDFLKKKLRWPKEDPNANPVVVFELCRHMALKESVRSLLRGSDKFKCHYCYKKHNILEVKDAYFIDL
ncbi:hypothetical protein PUMCH_003555 [Australozyma saopauloensis]|uniref:CTLH/CRA C-terminal to LisH motif domain-containing protein n=1 Tax=Australozyma saopauloensis TaxID=291208 RepID=A0AAX4HC99_9ASCO|nr:hypothetical protein PUMCH_003555 [[Candida] saopauloensis]